MLSLLDFGDQIMSLMIFINVCDSLTIIIFIIGKKSQTNEIQQLIWCTTQHNGSSFTRIADIKFSRYKLKLKEVSNIEK